MKRPDKKNMKYWWIIIQYNENYEKLSTKDWKTKMFGVYVEDNSMSRAVKKAVDYFRKKSAYKTLGLRKSFGNREHIQISFRRASRFEVAQNTGNWKGSHELI